MSGGQGDKAGKGRFPDAVRRFLAFDGVPIGGVAVGLMLGTYALLDLPPSGPLLLLAFCGTLLVYQLDRELGWSPEDRFNQPERQAWMRRHRTYVWSTVAGGTVFGVAAVPFLRPVTVGVGIGIGGIGILHVIPLLPGRRRLKAIGLVKPLTIGAAWALGSVLLPVIEAKAPVTKGDMALVGYRFCFVVPTVLLADLADRKGDARAGLHTVATRWTASQLRKMAGGILIFAVGGGLVAIWGFGAPALLYVDLIGPLLMGGVVGRWPSWSRWTRDMGPDLLVAWPAVTAAVWWIVGH